VLYVEDAVPAAPDISSSRRADTTNRASFSMMGAMTISYEPCDHCYPDWNQDGALVASCHGCGARLEATSITWPTPDTCAISFQLAEGYEHDHGCQGAHTAGPHWEPPRSAPSEWQEPDCWVTGCGNVPTSGSMSCDAHRCQATATTTNERCGNTAKDGPFCVQHRYPSGFPRDFTPTPEMLTWAREHTPDVDHEAEAGRFAAYWMIKRVRAPKERDWQELWRSWMTVAQDEALRLAKIPRNSGIGPGMIQQAQRIATG
jgi:hypothetical protein